MQYYTDKMVFHMISNLLIVCTGNICRSPMAEGIFKAYFSELALDVLVHSAGTNAVSGHPAVQYAQETMQEHRDIDISAHRAKQLVAEHIFESDLILVMESKHQRSIELAFPFAAGKVHRLGEGLNCDITDPYLRSKNDFAQILILMEKCLQHWQQKFSQVNIK